MILETNGPLIAEKVTSHNIDADSPLSEQVEQQIFSLLYVSNTLMTLQIEDMFNLPTARYQHFLSNDTDTGDCIHSLLFSQTITSVKLSRSFDG